MKTYVPDADVLAVFQRLRLGDRISRTAETSFIVTDVVWDELTGPAVPARYAEPAVEMLNRLAGSATVLLPESPEAATFAALHPQAARQDAGEHSVVAYALHHAEATPVLRDKTALGRAIEELRGRAILSVHGFAAALFEAGCLSLPVVTEFGRAYRSSSSQPAPTWWAALTQQE